MQQKELGVSCVAAECSVTHVFGCDPSHWCVSPGQPRHYQGLTDLEPWNFSKQPILLNLYCFHIYSSHYDGFKIIREKLETSM